MITLVYPVEGHHTSEETTFVMGHVTPEAYHGVTIKINHDAPVNPSAQGFFSIPVTLQPGKNTLQVQVVSQQGQPIETVTRQVVRDVSLPVTQCQLIAPTQAVGLMPGDDFLVAVVAPADRPLTAFIPHLTPEPMVLLPLMTTESTVDQRHNIFGALHWGNSPLSVEHYRCAVVTVPPCFHDQTPMDHQAIEIRDAKTHQTVLASEGLISIWDSSRWAAVSDANGAVVRVAPSTSAGRLTEQLPGTVLKGIGEANGYLKVALGNGQVGWVLQNQLAWTQAPQHQGFPIRLITTTTITPGKTRVTIDLPSNEGASPPVLIDATETTLTLSLFNSVYHCDVIPFDPEDALIRDITWAQVSPDRLTLTLVLAYPLSGYMLQRTSAGLELSLQSLGLLLQHQPVEATRILIDPGHGGDELGSVGLDGVPEKTRNLSLARLIQQALQEAGFKSVDLTRQADEAVPLQQRQALVKTTEADLCMSVHHNALPDGRDPTQHQGLSTYYYHPFVADFARFVQQQLVTQLQRPNYGVFYDNLAMTRIHTGLAILVEWGFFTHPDDFEVVRSESFQRQASSALTVVIKSYLRRLQEAHKNAANP